MEIRIKRTEEGEKFVLDCMVDFTIDERRAIARYKLADVSVGPSDTVSSLELGRRDTYPSLSALFADEISFRDACDRLRLLLAAAERLDGTMELVGKDEPKPAPEPPPEPPKFELPEALMPKSGPALYPTWFQLGNLIAFAGVVMVVLMFIRSFTVGVSMSDLLLYATLEAPVLLVAFICHGLARVHQPEKFK